MKAIKKYSAIVSALITPTAFAQIDVSLEYLNWTADTNKLAYVVNDLSGSVIPADIIEGNIQSIEGDSDDGGPNSQPHDNGHISEPHGKLGPTSALQQPTSGVWEGGQEYSDQAIVVAAPPRGGRGAAAARAADTTGARAADGIVIQCDHSARRAAGRGDGRHRTGRGKGTVSGVGTRAARRKTRRRRYSCGTWGAVATGCVEPSRLP